MEVVNVAEQIESIRSSAESMHAAKTEVVGSLSLGDVIRQGDLYLVRIEPVNGKEAASRQLAPGTTQGSRHVAEGACDVLACNAENVRNAVLKATGRSVHAELLGPVVQVRGESTITHPEHGDKVVTESCYLAVVYQRAYADEVRRVRD